MTNLLAARLQMAFFLGFQMIFAQISAALPVVVAVTEWRWLKTGDAVCLDSPCARSHRGTRLHD
jgi:cytochrome d ubiquinol oxidase subunit I